MIIVLPFICCQISNIILHLKIKVDIVDTTYVTQLPRIPRMALAVRITPSTQYLNIESGSVEKVGGGEDMFIRLLFIFAISSNITRNILTLYNRVSVSTFL